MRHDYEAEDVFPFQGEGATAGAKRQQKSPTAYNKVTAQQTNTFYLSLRSSPTTYNKLTPPWQHYAKYHGLRKDDLEFHFVDLLKDGDTPKSIMLEKGCEVSVRHKMTLGGR